MKIFTKAIAAIAAPVTAAVNSNTESVFRSAAVNDDTDILCCSVEDNYALNAIQRAVGTQGADDVINFMSRAN